MELVDAEWHSIMTRLPMVVGERKEDGLKGVLVQGEGERKEKELVVQWFADFPEMMTTKQVAELANSSFLFH